MFNWLSHTLTKLMCKIGLHSWYITTERNADYRRCNNCGACQKQEIIKGICKWK